VDIDPTLIFQAKKLTALRASRVRPPTKHADRVVDYFPMSAVLEKGFIEPRESSRAGSMTAWPRVSFCPADWVTTADQDVLGPYDTILALSVSIIQVFLWVPKLIRPGYQVDPFGTPRPRVDHFFQEVFIFVISGRPFDHRTSDMGIVRESCAPR